MKHILFDQDGTLIDSGAGIKHSAMKTLEKMGLPVIPFEELDFFIGPPLRDCFRMCNVPEERIEESVTTFREFYEGGGKYEGEPYPGLENLLITLKQEGYSLFVCTSKADFLAIDILKHFSLEPYFVKIYGAHLDGSRSLKSDIIKACLIENGEDAIMIGDTYLDIKGATTNNIPGIGVTWGYGDREKMKEEGASKIVSTMDELYEAIHSL